MNEKSPNQTTGMGITYYHSRTPPPQTKEEGKKKTDKP